ncbi:MAG: heavy metal-responsive transcriptional regulator [Nevskiaceae bacterium]|nr:MAG: heavy metal-responsive transcriptional regulator [Nevskiaceae bacterium]
MSGLTVSQLARAAGVGSETVRHYEEIGLLPKAVRGGNGYRVFPPVALSRMAFIRRTKNLGFGLPEIATLLDLSDRRQTDTATDMVRLQQAAVLKMEEIEARIRDLEQIRSGLSQLINSCPGAGSLADCPILNALSGLQTMPVEELKACHACPSS